MSVIRGVDGCDAGWLCVSLDLETGRVSAQIFKDAQALFSEPAVVTTIDIPIGLPSGQPRRCDGEARALLGPRAGSVFPCPVRATLAAESYEAACAASAAACGKRLSKQTYAILPRIRDVDTVMRKYQSCHDVYEVHPEVCFYFWNDRQPMRYSKLTGFGFVERHKLAAEAFGRAAEETRDAVPQTAASDDDILDALAALWTARRIHSGIATRLPNLEQRDECGLPMQMLA